jgi:hypothetical protein
VQAARPMGNFSSTLSMIFRFHQAHFLVLQPLPRLPCIHSFYASLLPGFCREFWHLKCWAVSRQPSSRAISRVLTVIISAGQRAAILVMPIRSGCIKFRVTPLGRPLSSCYTSGVHSSLRVVLTKSRIFLIAFISGFHFSFSP